MMKWLYLNKYQLGFIYCLGGLLLIQWLISLIAPFNALRSIEELNTLMILSDRELQNSHFIFSTLAIFVDNGINMFSLFLVLSPYISMENFIIFGIILTILFHPTERLIQYNRWFSWFLTAYGIILLTSIGLITAAFVANSPQRVLVLINSAGGVAVFGGIGLSLIILIWLSQLVMSIIRQK